MWTYERTYRRDRRQQWDVIEDEERLVRLPRPSALQASGAEWVGSGEPEHVPSRSKYLKVPLVEDSEGVAGRTWTRDRRSKYNSWD